jgi:YbbR domain-containing protein
MTDRGRKILNIILALLVATGAWFFVVYNYDPMTSERYSGVPITYTGLDTLANRGYAVSEANYKNVEVTLQQRRIDTTNISAEDISVTADVSGLSNGENTVALRVDGPEGTQVTDVSVKNVTVDIVSATTVEFPINIEYSEKPDDDAVPLVENISVATATVIASEDKLAEVDRVAAVIDPETVDEQYRAMTLEVAALDREGNRVINVVIYPETVSFRVAAGSTKEVRLVVPVKNDSDDSYERTYTVPETVVIKGKKSTIDAFTGITAKDIDIANYYEDAEIPIEFDLPEGVILEEPKDPYMLKLKVVEKEEEPEAETEEGNN